MVRIFIPGIPVPKQSFRFRNNGKHFTDKRIVNWSNTIKTELDKLHIETVDSTSLFRVNLIFVMQDHKRRDLDNCSKGVLDPINGIIWKDDTQVHELNIRKTYDKNNPGVLIEIEPLPAGYTDGVLEDVNLFMLHT